MYISLWFTDKGVKSMFDLFISPKFFIPNDFGSPIAIRTLEMLIVCFRLDAGAPESKA